MRGWKAEAVVAPPLRSLSPTKNPAMQIVPHVGASKNGCPEAAREKGDEWIGVNVQQ
jgi:hypothetical protein